jgi:hypothetical protein
LVIAKSTPPSIRPKELAALTMQSKAGSCSKRPLKISTSG